MTTHLVTTEFKCTTEQLDRLGLAAKMIGIWGEVVRNIHASHMSTSNGGYWVVGIGYTGPSAVRTWNRFCELATKLGIIT